MKIKVFFMGLALFIGLSLSCNAEAKNKSLLPDKGSVDFSEMESELKNSSNDDAPNGTKDIFTVLYTIIEGGGTLMLIYGTIKYGIGMTSDEPREYAKGVSFIVSGAILANISLAVNM